MDQQDNNKINPLLRGSLWLIAVAISLGILIYFKGLLIPFIYAIFVAFLVNELVVLMGRIQLGGRSLPRWLRSILVLALVVSSGIIIVEIVSANVNQISKKIPEYEVAYDNLLIQLGDLTGAEDISKAVREQVDSEEINRVISGAFNSFSSILGNLFMILLYSIFMLSERKTIPLKLRAMVSNSEQFSDVRSVLERIGEAVQQYISVKTFVSFLTGLISYIILLLFGVDFPVLWAFLIFLLNYIPYLGAFIATILPALLAVFQFESLLIGLFVFLAIQGVQTLMGSFVEPKISGQTLNLSPTIVLFSLAFWGALWGIVGLAIAIPLTSVLVITLSEFPSTRNAAILLSEDGDVEED
ncbi:MAG: AI-2E family transporter [Saprospiraceae bacterium]